jgi:hypothetical protein
MIDYEDYDNDESPTKGKMTASRERVVNHNMATLKRAEGRINRYRKNTTGENNE